MNRFYRWVGIVFLVVLPLRFCQVLFEDLQTPEVWDHDVSHDPRVYVPMMIVALTVLVGGIVWAILKDREQPRQFNARERR